MMPITLTNLCLQEYHPHEIGRDLEQFLDANCDGQDWLATLPSELQEIFVFLFINTPIKFVSKSKL